ARAETRVEVREVEVVREVEGFREIGTPLPDWRIGAMIGVDLSNPGPAYGLQVERRSFGPIYVGAWGMSTGAIGIGVSVIFWPAPPSSVLLRIVSDKNPPVAHVP